MPSGTLWIATASAMEIPSDASESETAKVAIPSGKDYVPTSVSNRATSSSSGALLMFHTP